MASWGSELGARTTATPPPREKRRRGGSIRKRAGSMSKPFSSLFAAPKEPARKITIQGSKVLSLMLRSFAKPDPYNENRNDAAAQP